MIEIYLFTAIALVATGVVIGIIVVVSVGILLEDRDGRLLAVPHDRVARGARVLTGVYVRRSETAQEAGWRPQDTLQA